MKEITIGLFCFVFVHFFCFFQAAFEGVTGASEADGSFGLFRRLDARLGADGWLNGHPTGQQAVETAGQGSETGAKQKGRVLRDRKDCTERLWLILCTLHLIRLDGVFGYHVRLTRGRSGVRSSLESIRDEKFLFFSFWLFLGVRCFWVRWPLLFFSRGFLLLTVGETDHDPRWPWLC